MLPRDGGGTDAGAWADESACGFDGPDNEALGVENGEKAVIVSRGFNRRRESQCPPSYADPGLQQAVRRNSWSRLATPFPAEKKGVRKDKGYTSN